MTLLPVRVNFLSCLNRFWRLSFLVTFCLVYIVHVQFVPRAVFKEQKKKKKKKEKKKKKVLKVFYAEVVIHLLQERGTDTYCLLSIQLYLETTPSPVTLFYHHVAFV